MPAPKKDEENWDTGAPDYIDQPFDFDQETNGELSGTKIQLDGMVWKVKAAQAEIECTYPVGGCALFPNKQVWHNKQNDTYFELSHVQTKYWAVNIFNFPYTHTTPYLLPIFPSVNTLASLHPPGSTTSCSVTLQEFCTKYHIPKSDQDKLALMEYCPGNHAVEDLEESKWRKVGSFTNLGWEVF
ncbi:hypothetical protein EDC04DRAFT_2605297 [Pisolithus marmoratus]|nr:hypothetical protein EDC04DRAFT_2605297 [Pisolithus marmoratus]